MRAESRDPKSVEASEIAAFSGPDSGSQARAIPDVPTARLLISSEERPPNFGETTVGAFRPPSRRTHRLKASYTKFRTPPFSSSASTSPPSLISTFLSPTASLGRQIPCSRSVSSSSSAPWKGGCGSGGRESTSPFPHCAGSRPVSRLAPSARKTGATLLRPEPDLTRVTASRRSLTPGSTGLAALAG